MNFKRKESFRYAFEEPIGATFKVMQNGSYLEMRDNLHPCYIADISPRGMKLYSTTNLEPLLNDLLTLEINFVLDVVSLTGVGRIVWSKPYGKGCYYGISICEEHSIEDMIVDELKKRRRKEVLQQKNRVNIV